MTIRTRLIVVASLAVAVAVALASLAAFLVVRHELYHSIDGNIAHVAKTMGKRLERLGHVPTHRPPAALPGGRIEELIQPGGHVLPLASGDPRLRVSSVFPGGPLRPDRLVYNDTMAGGSPYRVVALSVKDFGTLVVGAPLVDVEQQLHDVELLLGAVALAGILVAATLGWVVSRTALTPLVRLSRSVEEVAKTGDLARRIGGNNRDEIGRLGTTFDGLLAALEQSRDSQRRLVEDTAHELRTPLTSLRTNSEVLRSTPDIGEEDRIQILDDVVSQVEELTVLLGDLVETTRAEEPEIIPHEVRLDSLVKDALDAVGPRSRAAGVHFDVHLEPSVVRAVPLTARAITNLLDNATKWSPPGGSVEVSCRNGSVTVRDHGPGIEETELSKVFDRFYRSPSARSFPGSGLGLAIVRQAAESAGGQVTAQNAPGGGAILRFELPLVPMPPKNRGGGQSPSGGSRTLWDYD